MQLHVTIMYILITVIVIEKNVMRLLILLHKRLLRQKSIHFVWLYEYDSEDV